jgi:hypothetical protein
MITASTIVFFIILMICCPALLFLIGVGIRYTILNYRETTIGIWVIISLLLGLAIASTLALSLEKKTGVHIFYTPIKEEIK